MLSFNCKQLLLPCLLQETSSTKPSLYLFTFSLFVSGFVRRTSNKLAHVIANTIGVDSFCLDDVLLANVDV